MINPRPSSTLPSFVRRFRTMGAVTIWAVYILILVGAIVRGTGAGMGCPDWPKCFDRWVPPTDVAELPADYLIKYRDGRISKNQQVAQRLDRLGFHEVAARIFRNPATYIETEFNPVKTWIEYVNRLMGALTGVFIILTFLYSWPYRRRDLVVTICAFLALVTVGVQGWLGSLVVSTNLVPVIVTWHMALALVLLVLLHYLMARTRPDTEVVLHTSNGLKLLATGLLLLTFVQVLLGTQVREEVDRIGFAFNQLNRDLWVARLGADLGWHRTFSTILLLANVYAGWQLWLTDLVPIRRLTKTIGILLAVNLVVGLALTKLALPPWLQPVHLAVATLLFGAQAVLMLKMWVKGPELPPADEENPRAVPVAARHNLLHDRI